MGNSNSKQTLIRLLTFIRDCEAEKPLDEMNMGLIEACVKLLLKLQKKEIVFTTEQIKERVRKIPFVLTPDFGGETTKKVKKYTTKKKILLVAAIIALLAMLGSIVSVANEWNIFDYVREYIGYENVIHDKEYRDNGMSFTSNQIVASFDNINDYSKNNTYDILLPTYLPSEISVDKIIVSDMIENYRIDMILSDNTFSYFVLTDTLFPEIIINNCDETVVVGSKTVYITSLPDIGIYQMYFEHNGNYYELCYTDKQELLKVIENLEE